jgi:acylphosphatase
MEQQRLQANISGLVQGVYFRDTTSQQAQALGVAGWVRNQPDGSVEVLAEGPRPQLETLLKFLHQGPHLARVDKVQAQWLAATGEFSAFEIRW